MNKNITIAIIAIIAIVVSVVFIIRSNPSARTAEASPIRELPALNEKTSLPQDVVATDPGLANRLRERLSTQDAMTALTPVQVDRLVEQTAAILSVYAGGTFDDYLALMESWGGTCMLGEKDLARFRPGWKPPDHALSYAHYGIGAATVAVQESPERIEVGGDPNFSGLTLISQFRFKAHQSDLLKGRTKEVEIWIPAETNSGDTVEQRIFMLWSPDDDAWIPFFSTITSKRNRPMPAKLF